MAGFQSCVIRTRFVCKSEACDRSGFASRNVTSAEKADGVASIGSGEVMVCSGFGAVNLIVALGISTVMLAGGCISCSGRRGGRCGLTRRLAGLLGFCSTVRAGRSVANSKPRCPLPDESPLRKHNIGEQRRCWHCWGVWISRCVLQLEGHFELDVG